MKRFFLLLCVFCALYTFSAFSACGLSWANNFGSSIEGESATVTFTHTADCDSARIEFGYQDTTNFYFTADALPAFSASGMILLADGVDLDSIGTHIVKITYFEDNGDAVADGYVTGIWLHEDPTPGDTIGREASTFDPATDTVAYVDSLIEELTITSVDSVRKVYIVDSLDQTIEATCTGTGEHTLIIIVLDDSDSSGLNGCLVQVEDSATGGMVGYDNTNAAGICTFGVATGSYTTYLTAPRWTITSPVYINVSGDTSLTYYATGITPSPPPVDSVCVVYGYINNKDGSSAVGAKVEIWMDVYGVTYHDVLIDVITHTSVRTNTAGYFEFSAGVYPNDLLLPANTKWKILITTDFRIWEQSMEVPIGDSWQVDFTLP